MIDFMTVVKALPYLANVAKSIPEVAVLVHEVIGGFGESDQTTLKNMLVKLSLENDVAHNQVQQDLGEAEKK